MLERVGNLNKGLVYTVITALFTVLISAGSCAATTLIDHGNRLSTVETSTKDVIKRLDRIEDKLDKALIK